MQSLTRTALRGLLTLVLVGFLAGCGGGSAPPEGVRAFVAGIAQQDTRAARKHVLAVNDTVDANAMLDWIEYKFPDLFPRGPASFQLDADGQAYTVRAYAHDAGARYLGISASGGIYGLGDFTNNVLQQFGVVTDFAVQVTADSCSVYPDRCPAVTNMNFIATAPARLEVTFNRPMDPTYFTTGSYVPTSTVWESTTKLVITFSSYSAGGLITLKAPTAADSRGFKSADGAAMSADVSYQFPSDPPPSSGAPSVANMNFVATTPARLEVTFDRPMDPTHFTTGSYVPTSTVWESTTKLVITFSSFSPGGLITLKAPTASDSRGFKSAAGAAMSADVSYQFPSDSPSSSGAPSVSNLNFIATAPARLEVTFNQPMDRNYYTVGAYVPTSSVWESSTKLVITFSSYSSGGFITLKAPTATDSKGFRSAAGVAMSADVSYQFPPQ